MTKPHTIGIISDTHGVLPTEVFELFSDVDQIIHAGDVGSEDILIELGGIAPTVAVCGNMDRGRYAAKLKERLDFHLYGFDFIVTHIPGPFTADNPTIRINGHTHEAKLLNKNGSMLINPGSASQPRNRPERSVAILVLKGEGEAEAKIHYF
jgi:putative phosphoesterase